MGNHAGLLANTSFFRLVSLLVCLFTYQYVTLSVSDVVVLVENDNAETSLSAETESL